MSLPSLSRPMCRHAVLRAGVSDRITRHERGSPPPCEPAPCNLHIFRCMISCTPLWSQLYGRSCAPCAHSQAKSVQTARPSSKAGNSEPGSGSSKGPAPTQEEARCGGPANAVCMQPHARRWAASPPTHAALLRCGLVERTPALACTQQRARISRWGVAPPSANLSPPLPGFALLRADDDASRRPAQPKHAAPPSLPPPNPFDHRSSSGQDDVDNLLLRSLEAEASLDEEGSGGRGALFAGIGLAAGIALLLGGGYVFR